MPENRPGRGVYLTNGNTGTLTHGQVVAQDNYVGVAVKQKAAGWKDGLEAHSLIAKSEEYFLITKGKVLVDAVEGAEKGDAIYIDSENELTDEAENNTAFGRVTEVASERGTPAGKMWVDLDVRHSLPAE